MSLLLEALRKADRDREQSHKPAGIDSTATIQVASTGLGKFFVVLLAVLVVILAGALAWLLSTEDTPAPELPPVVTERLASPSKDTPNPQPEPDDASKTEAPIEDIKPAKSNETPAPEVMVTSVGTLAMVGEAYSEISPPVSAPEPAVVSKDEALSDTSVNDEVMALYQQTQEEAPTPAEAPEVPASMTGTIAAAEKPFEQIGGVRSLPLAVQNSVPTLMYAAHNYNPAGDSSVVINGRIWREGESVSQGITLEAVQADGIILRSGQHRFTLKALSSWVNM
ncbi:general secretion pathway protein GspB [Gilvimarinus sp. SDUM040013]|uniref:General secretion pathway protein GspB n=1 Tax=Gilvimarinus gilvus TaxID=3058038 RepID=A0ABU4RXU6_9GAMM|nr:general secretion pathway protein GspB [Gilvimarinus sp. SDUM040013]MDO3386475.1 general secretion pathway protein GspB [Gilvimarinus sp. SDUM040013]MDX6849051.1 general secretion pathway protein GspB [Gilvimarinus sp. SDUM040013]